MQTNKSKELFAKAKKYIPGGVNSPARAFAAVGGEPRFIERADKQFIYDADGNKYIDYIGSWGPMILGNNADIVRDAVSKAIKDGLSFGAATAKEAEMAELVCSLVPSIEMVRMVNSGTEATMSALRVARGYTKRDKIIKFEGNYHGHNDSLLVKSGSALIASGGSPDSAGVTKGCVSDTLVAVYNDLESVKRLFEQFGGEIAAIIVEPVAANMGVVSPREGFLEGLRVLCDKYGSVLIFDEVITGFRIALGGAQEFFGVKPDMTTFGKIIGAGMPVGAYGGRRDIMECVSPLGQVYQAGTLSGNPVAMAAGLAQLNYLKDNPKVYEHINELGNMLYGGIAKIVKDAKAGAVVNNIGSIGTLFFTEDEPQNYETARKSDIAEYARYFNYMLNAGNYFAPAQFEAGFMSYAHTKADIEKTLQDVKAYFALEA